MNSKSELLNKILSGGRGDLFIGTFKTIVKACSPAAVKQIQWLHTSTQYSLTQLKSRHQIKAAMQQKRKFNTINLIIEHNHLTVPWVGFKRWYWSRLLIIERCVVRMRPPHDGRFQVCPMQEPSAMHLGGGRASSRMGRDEKGFPGSMCGRHQQDRGGSWRASTSRDVLPSWISLVQTSVKTAPASHRWRKGRAETWSNHPAQTTCRSRNCVQTERTSLELLLRHWREGADANALLLGSLGFFQSWRSSSPRVTCRENPPFWRTFSSLFSLSWLTGWSEKVKVPMLWSMLLGQGRQSFTSRQLAGLAAGRGGFLHALSWLSHLALVPAWQRFPPGAVTASHSSLVP